MSKREVDLVEPAVLFVDAIFGLVVGDLTVRVGGKEFWEDDLIRVSTTDRKLLRNSGLLFPLALSIARDLPVSCSVWCADGIEILATRSTIPFREVAPVSNHLQHPIRLQRGSACSVRSPTATSQYSALACFEDQDIRIGIFQSVRKSWYAARALPLSPCKHRLGQDQGGPRNLSESLRGRRGDLQTSEILPLPPIRCVASNRLLSGGKRDRLDPAIGRHRSPVHRR